MHLVYDLNTASGVLAGLDDHQPYSRDVLPLVQLLYDLGKVEERVHLSRVRMQCILMIDSDSTITDTMHCKLKEWVHPTRVRIACPLMTYSDPTSTDTTHGKLEGLMSFSCVRVQCPLATYRDSTITDTTHDTLALLFLTPFS